MDRQVNKGFCGCDDNVTVSGIMLHHYEEPVISGTNGSGAIFFSGCNLKCVYCQNGAISTVQSGKKYTQEHLVRAMLKLQQSGAHNINLITPTPYINDIAKTLEVVKPSLKIPVIYNCGGYESVEMLQKLEGLVDIYLPDFKYMDNEIAKKYSFASDYSVIAQKAIAEMLRQQKEVVIENGLIKKGVIIRHLVLPGHRDDSIAVIKCIAQNFPTAKISLMRQYTPQFNRSEFKNLDRKITSFEYDSVVQVAISFGLDGFVQQKGCENEKFTPDFAKFFK